MVSTPSPRASLKLSVPREDGTLLVEPAWRELPELIKGNHAELAKGKLTYLGKPEEQLRLEAQEAVISAARGYLDELGLSQPPLTTGGPILMGGHQPTLFHPGVWVKNFALAELAAQTGGIAINLVIDNDLAETTRFSYPDQKNERLHTGHIEFGGRIVAQPWEELAAPSEADCHDFAARLTESLSRWNVTPALTSVWEEACRRSSGNLSRTFTIARGLLERQLGVDNMELPISRLSHQRPFLWFALHLLVELTSFRETYNSQLAAYRDRNKIRNEQHPVPDLAVNGDWQEAPFWIWNAGATQRNHVWIKIAADAIILSDGETELASIPHPDHAGVDASIAALMQLEQREIRFRPRALTTTLYARLFLCDLFVHGIGGAKYDEVTDDLLREFYQHEPPRYLTLSGTIHFPLPGNVDVTREEVDQLKDRIRDLQYHPDQHLSSAQQQTAKSLLNEREALLTEQNAYKELSKAGKKAASEHNRQRFQRLKEIAQELSALVEPERERLASELSRLESLWEERQVQVNREYPAMFYPAEKLNAFMMQLREEIRAGFSA